MRTCYVLPESRTIADLVQPHELTQWWTITRINVPEDHRGKGLGSAILNLILVEADVERITLAVEVSASDGLNHEQLEAWYARKGFKNRKSGYLVRLPSDCNHNAGFVPNDSLGQMECELQCGAVSYPTPSLPDPARRDPRPSVPAYRLTRRGEAVLHILRGIGVIVLYSMVATAVVAVLLMSYFSEVSP